MSTICRVQYLFLSWRTCGLPHFINIASQILNQMMMECPDSSPTQGTTGSAKLTPNSNCFASQLSCSRASSRSRCSLLSHLPLIIPCLAKAEVLGLSFPSTLGFCLIREPCQHKEQEEKRAYKWLHSGWVRSWNGLCLYFSSLPLSQLPDVLGAATEWRRKETRLLEFIHTAHRAAPASLPVCKEISLPLTAGHRKRQASG